MSRRRRILIALAALLAALLVLGAPRLGAHLVRSRALPRAEARLGRSIRVGEIRVRPGRVELFDVVVDGSGAPEPLVAARISARFRLLPLLRGRIEIDEVVVDHPRLHVVRGEHGQDNVSSILDRLRERRSDPPGAPARVSGPELARVVAGVVEIEDPDWGTIKAGPLDLRAARHGPGQLELADIQVRLAAGPTAQAHTLTARFQLDRGPPIAIPEVTVEGGSLSVWKGFSLSGVTGTIGPDSDDPTRARIGLRGGYGGVDRVLWSADGFFQPRDRSGHGELVARRFDLGQLRPILDGSLIVDPERTEIDARLELDFQGDPAPDHLHDALDFKGRVELSGLNLFHRSLAPQPVRDLAFEANARGRFEPRARHLTIADAAIDYRGVHAALTADVQHLGKRPAFSARFSVLPVPCQTALAALPVEMTPRLRGFRLAGSFGAEVRATIDLADLDHGFDFGGDIGIDGCRVLEAPPRMDLTRLLTTFRQVAEVVPGEWKSFIAGPENPDWVPYAEISPHLVHSIMTTEDPSFFNHKGFIAHEFRSALKSNLEHGYFRIGASSITMQMVKNVLLTREKTLARKLQELFLSWHVEHSLPKERILEIYFNVIEFGPRIYGIGAAARHYFGKSAHDLQPREAVWFSSILPSPKRRYAHFCRGAPDPRWEAYLDRLLRRLLAKGLLTQPEFDTALAARLRFDRTEAAPERECLDQLRKLLDVITQANRRADLPAVTGDDAAPEDEEP